MERSSLKVVNFTVVVFRSHKNISQNKKMKRVTLHCDRVYISTYVFSSWKNIKNLVDYKRWTSKNITLISFKSIMQTKGRLFLLQPKGILRISCFMFKILICTPMQDTFYHTSKTYNYYKIYEQCQFLFKHHGHNKILQNLKDLISYNKLLYFNQIKIQNLLK